MLQVIIFEKNSDHGFDILAAEWESLTIKKAAWGRWLKWVIKNLRSPIASQFLLTGFDNAGLVRIDKDFMECEVCGERCKRRAQVFIQGDELQLCLACVLRLRTQRLKYCQERQKYRFNGNLRKRGLLRGRIWRDLGAPNIWAALSSYRKTACIKLWSYARARCSLHRLLIILYPVKFFWHK